MNQTKTSERMMHLSILKIAQATGAAAARNVLVNFVMERDSGLLAVDNPLPASTNRSTPVPTL